MRQVALDAGLQNLLRPRVAQGASVLVEQIHQLFGDHPEKRAKISCNFSAWNFFVTSFEAKFMLKLFPVELRVKIGVFVILTTSRICRNASNWLVMCLKMKIYYNYRVL